MLPPLAVDDPLRAARGDAAAALHRAAAALLRGEPGQEDGGARHRPAQHLRQHHLGAAEPLLCPAGAEALRARGQGLAGQRLPGREVRPLGRVRLHRPAREPARRRRRRQPVLEGRAARVLGPVRGPAGRGRRAAPARGDRRARPCAGAAPVPAGDGETDPRLCPRCGEGRLGAEARAASGRSSAARATRTATTPAPSPSAAARRATARRDARTELLGRRPRRCRGGLAEGRAVRALRPARHRCRRPSAARCRPAWRPTSSTSPWRCSCSSCRARSAAIPRPSSRSWPGINRYGPFVQLEKKFVRLEPGDDVLTVGMNRAMALLNEPAKGRRAAAPTAPLRELGPHPKDDEPVQLLAGPVRPLRQARQAQRQPAQGARRRTPSRSSRPCSSWPSARPRSPKPAGGAPRRRAELRRQGRERRAPASRRSGRAPAKKAARQGRAEAPASAPERGPPAPAARRRRPAPRSCAILEGEGAGLQVATRSLQAP